MHDYGPFDYLVSGGTAVVGAAIALGSLWRPKAKWEPDIEELPQAPERMALIATACGIALLWVVTRDGRNPHFAVGALIASGLVCVIGLLLYIALLSVLIYEKQVVSNRELTSKGVIGGFRLSAAARKAIREDNYTAQDAFAGVEYDPTLMWSRWSIAIAKISLVLAYLLFVAGGTLTLAAAGAVSVQ
jgi:hypothetical protein